MRQPLPDDLLTWWRPMDGVDDADYPTTFTFPGAYKPRGVDQLTAMARLRPASALSR